MSILPPSTEHVLTPDVYLNHFLPPEAREEEIRRDITMVLVGVVLWDVVAYIPSDIKIIRGSRFRFTILCFILSRLMVVVYMFIVMLHRTVPVIYYGLNASWYASSAAIILVIMTSSYLFLQRVLAVYSTGKWIRGFFIVSWVMLSIASAVVVPIGGKPAIFPGTKYYIFSKLKPWVALCNWGLLAFDTAVMVAISFKLGRSFSDDGAVMSTEYGENHMKRVSMYSIMTGKHLPKFARAIVRGGQLYYMITVGVTILVGIIVTLRTVSPVYGDLLPSFLIFFSGSMACRVFRNTKLFDFGTMESFGNIYALQHIVVEVHRESIT